MLDVRNAIANILDRYTLADIVGVTLRKLRHDQASFHLGEVFGGVFETNGDAKAGGDLPGDNGPALPRRSRRVPPQSQPVKG